MRCQSLSLVQYRAATSSKKLVCTRMQAARQEIMWQLHNTVITHVRVPVELT